MKKYEDDNKQNPEISKITELPQNNIQNDDSQNQHPWDKKPLSNRTSCYIFRKSIVFLGIVILLLNPVVFYVILVIIRSEPTDNKAIIGASIFLFIGWLISEIGLILSKASKVVQILLRVVIYLYILLCFIFLVFYHLFSQIGP